MKKITQKSLRSLERLESNYKLIYTVVMGATLVVSIENLLVSAVNNTSSYKLFRGVSNISGVDIVMYLIFLSLFTRFYLGDLRYLDLKYLESQQGDAYKSRYSPYSRFFDFCSLILHAILFYALATSLNQFDTFTKIYTAILGINAIWLGIAYLSSNPTNRHRVELKSTLYWTLNNTVAFLFLLLYQFAKPSMTELNSITIFLTLAGINAVVDYASAWKLYFPNIQEELIEPPK